MTDFRFMNTLIRNVCIVYFSREVYTKMSMFATAAGLSVSASGFEELPTTDALQAAIMFEGHG